MLAMNVHHKVSSSAGPSFTFFTRRVNVKVSYMESYFRNMFNHKRNTKSKYLNIYAKLTENLPLSF